MSGKFEPRRIGLASGTAVPRGRAITIPYGGTGGGAEFGALIADEDRTFAVTREPVAHRIVFTVAHDIFDNWFRVTLEGKEKDEAFDKLIQTELTRIKAKRELMRMAVFERAYGWAVLVLGYLDSGETLADPARNPQKLEEVKAYSPLQITNVDEVKDKTNPRYGLPEYYYIKQSGMVTGIKIHYTRVIHFASRLLEHDWKGISALDPVWDDLVTLRNIRWGMGQTMYRYGHGFPDLTFTGAEKSDIDDWIADGNFANLSARTYFAHNENQTIEFKGAAGVALNPMNYYLPIMENISAGSGIPLAILRGAQAGALTGSEVNQQEYYGLVSDEQSYYESGIRELVNILLGIEKVAEFKFDWLGGFELDALKKQQVAFQRAQELDLLWNFYKRNEIRKMIDPDIEELTPEEGGDDLKTKTNGPQPEVQIDPLTGLPEKENPFQKKEEQVFPKEKEGDKRYTVIEHKPHNSSG